MNRTVNLLRFEIDIDNKLAFKLSTCSIFFSWIVQLLKLIWMPLITRIFSASLLTTITMLLIFRFVTNTDLSEVMCLETFESIIHFFDKSIDGFTIVKVLSELELFWLWALRTSLIDYQVFFFLISSLLDWFIFLKKIILFFQAFFSCFNREFFAIFYFKIFFFFAVKTFTFFSFNFGFIRDFIDDKIIFNFLFD